MKWYQNLYIGKNALKRNREIQSTVEQEQNMLMVYLITLSPDQRNQLEIITPTVFYQQAKRWGYPMIVGIAWGMREAKEVLVQMTEDVYRELGILDYRQYFERKMSCGEGNEQDEQASE